MKLQKLKDIKNKLFRNYAVYKEDYDYYSASTLFMNDIIRRNGLEGETVLSMAGKTGYIVACLPFFKMVIHCTMMPMEDKSAIKKLCGGGILIERTGDFFERSAEELYMNEVKVCISHAAIHCMNDTRYGNKGQKKGRPYLFAGKLCELCPNVQHVIVSVPVNEKEHMADNATWLSDRKFIKSFTDHGFVLKNTAYDKHCLPENEYSQSDRITKEFPSDYCKSHPYVAGNYYFFRKLL